MLPQKLAFVDIETTGLGVTRDRIIEIGILRVEENGLVDSFHTLINPEGYVSPFSLELTGITQKELDEAPTFFEVQDDIFTLLKDCTFVAHNVRFDYGFIRNEFRRYQKKFSAKHFCTVKLSQALFPTARKHNLDAIIERFHFTCANRHRAFDDAKVLWDFYQIVQKSFSKDVLEKAVTKAARMPSRPIAVAKKVIDALPEGPGVYIFYGENNTPLYIGKSINIQERVKSHFASDHVSIREMNITQQIKDIEAISTNGELGALIKEAQLIKKMQPLYNRQLRYMRKLSVLKKKLDADGYPIVIHETVDRLFSYDLPEIVGVFRSKRQAKEFLVPLVKEFQLCEKLLGLEKTTSSCFAYRLGHCKGACIKEEKALSYLVRFTEAFSKHTIKPWPFTGPIVICEEDTNEDTGEYFLIDKWCLLSQYASQEESLLEKQLHENVFDLDTYKLLVRFLEKRKNWKYIKQITSKEVASYQNV